MQRVDELTSGLQQALQANRPDADVELLWRAFDVATHCHQGQLRRSGDPYITHPLMVTTILARQGADDQTLCAAMLHDTVEDTPLTLTALRRGFGPGIATLVAEHTRLDHIGHQKKMARALATIMSADSRVVTMKMADRLHNMQTLQFLPQPKQLRKAREVLDFFVPVADQLELDLFSSELQTLAFAALIRNRPAPISRQRLIVALDIESSTSRPDAVKADLRAMLYELFDAALRSAGIHRRQRDRFVDRGDGLLALIHSLDGTAKARLLTQVIPRLRGFLATYNQSLPSASARTGQLRARAVIHAGEVRRDIDGYYGEALDIAFRLLDAPSVKSALKMARDPLALVVSDEIHKSVVQCASGGIDPDAYHCFVSVQVAENCHSGWVYQSRPGTQLGYSGCA